MNFFVFTIAFLFSNTLFAAPSYDATAEWLVKKMPVAGSFEDNHGTVTHKLDLQVVGKKFILKYRYIEQSSKHGKWDNNYTYTFNIEDLLSATTDKWGDVILNTKKLALHIEMKGHNHRGKPESKNEYKKSIELDMVNKDIGNRIAKAFQHLIDITDSSEPF